MKTSTFAVVLGIVIVIGLVSLLLLRYFNLRQDEDVFTPMPPPPRSSFEIDPDEIYCLSHPCTKGGLPL